MNFSGRRARPGGAKRAIAVVSDGSALTVVDGDDTVALVLTGYANLLRYLTGLQVDVCPVEGDDGGELATRVHAVARDYRSVFLTHAEPARSQDIQRRSRQWGGGCVVTDHDAMAIALVAAARTALAGRGAAAGESKVLAVGSRHLPGLAGLLVASGVGDLVLWNATGSLPRSAARSDVIIDVSGGVAPQPADGPVLITRGDAHAAPYAAAGLLSATTRSTRLTCGSEVYGTVARVLAAEGAPDWHLDHAAARALVDRITAALLGGAGPGADRRPWWASQC
ncbi:hypothetical protein [Amycolatopsis sp. NPDC051903]|uniref:hypothetical protein n=1 Tax=Amycolatopsis sp. NPDC051903 TaxID=3363936 RepID=UPI0037926BCD